ncbi:MAG: histidine kinase dimerization/phospho-acceptor domain-containing protein, partial [Bacteroidales bacterium]|nr:histidine kinase dimerization/phospho-acceptor domain-containing protein [Bacteroidales bacterium]
MKIKKKLTLGLGLLFTLIMLLALFGIRQINSLATDTENILKDNYKTLDYARNMLKSISDLKESPKALDVFEDFLVKQKNNITEDGEKELTAELWEYFYQLKKNQRDTAAIKHIHSNLFEIIRLNLEAVHQKSSIASKTSEHSVLWISLLGAFCFLIAFGLFVTLPGNISRPIEELIESIKQIASNNYSQRVNFENHNEFGELAKSFNSMVEKLDEFNHSNMVKLLTEKKITETLINKIHDPIIGFDKNMKVIFVNEEFLKISKLELNQIIEKEITTVAPENKLIEAISSLNTIKHKNEKVTSPDSQIVLESGDKQKYFEREIVEISYTSAGEEIERLMGYVVLLRNITKFKELDLAKTNFIATVSHELKTPISSIKLSLQLLENEKSGKINYTQKELIKSVEEDTNQLLKIIGELLNLAQVESGNIQ